ncbi:MAG: hypothetical protein ACKVPX_14325 [Myxococcaceae bacterium]
MRSHKKQTARPYLRTLRPDSKQRVTLGALAEGVSSYSVETPEPGVVILRANVEIPAREAWLWKNADALSALKTGLRDSAEGRTVARGSFAKYAEED